MSVERVTHTHTLATLNKFNSAINNIHSLVCIRKQKLSLLLPIMMTMMMMMISKCRGHTDRNAVKASTTTTKCDLCIKRFQFARVHTTQKQQQEQQMQHEYCIQNSINNYNKTHRKCFLSSAHAFRCVFFFNLLIDFLSNFLLCSCSRSCARVLDSTWI